MTYSSVAGLASDGISRPDPSSADFFMRLTRGIRCQLALNLMPRQITPEDYLQRANALYAAGVQNLFFWDCYQRNNFDPGGRPSGATVTLRNLPNGRSRAGPPVFETGRSWSMVKVGDWNLSFPTPG